MAPLRSYRRLVVTASLVVAAGLILTVGGLNAPPAPPETALGTSVWVLDRGQRAVARVNTAIAEVDAVVAVPSGPTELVQHGSQVVIVDRGSRTLRVIDSARSVAGAAVDLPTADARVMLTDDLAIIHSPSRGLLWSVPVDGLAQFDAARTPDLDTGGRSLAEATPDGDIVVVRADAGEVLRWRADSDEVVQRSAVGAPLGRDLQLAVGDDGWALLDRAARTLFTGRHTVDLSRWLPSGGDVLLQRSHATDDSVLIATDAELFEVHTSSGEAITVSAGHSGFAARPVSASGCSFAAWSDGTQWSRCAESASGLRSVIDRMDPAARLEYRVNTGQVLLSDPMSGQAWAVNDGNRLVGGWGDYRSTVSGARATGSRPPRADEQVQPSEPPGPPVQPHERESAPAKRVRQLLLPESLPAPATGESRQPIATALTLEADAAAAAVTVRWAPFGGDDPVRGYFVQSLDSPADASVATCRVDPTSGEVTAPTGGEVRLVGSGPTTFGGLTRTDASYRFSVWGFTAHDCTASETVGVIVRSTPTALSSVAGGMEEIGDTIDYRLGSLSSDVSGHELQRLSEDGTPAGNIVRVRAGDVPRAMTGGEFGDRLRFRIRACEPWSCGQWTSWQADAASIDFAPVGLDYSADTGEWTWSALPDNGGLDVGVNCGSRSDAVGQVEVARGSCRTDVAVAADDAWLRVQVGDRWRDF